MNIAIDTSPLESAHSNRGIGVYTKNLIKALKEFDNSHSYSLFTRGQNLPKNTDLVHYPYFDPFFLTLPLIKKLPTVVTVHDLIPMIFPDQFPTGIRGNIKWFIQKKSLLGVTRIITDSQSSKKDIVHVTGYNPESVDVIPLAPDEAFKPANDENVLKKYSINKPYLLYVGDINWNKNVQGLLQAFAQIKKTKKLQLVLVGSAFKDNSLREAQHILDIIRALKIEHEVIMTGYVPDTSLPALYSGALCLVVPSFYEGFGLPVLEAMACGCTVVASNNSSLSEILGPAITIDPTVDSIISGIKKIFTTNITEIRRKQFAWVKEFTWKRVAQNTIATYNKTF